MKHFNKVLIVLIVLIFPSLFIGCSKIDKMKVKLGMKNEDFEYIRQSKVNKIVIQSTRDKGFRFIVEDKKAISDMYEILSSAKHVSTKTTLKPDYIFEMYENDESVHQFKYVVGIDKKDGGNLYDEKDNIYIVSERLDNDIIKNFWNIRIPKKFEKVYYGSLLEVLKKYSSGTSSPDVIGVDINNDVEVKKFLLSSELEQFKLDIKDKRINGELKQDDKKDYNITMTVSTEGYTPLLYKGIVKFWDKKKNTEKVYYIWDIYENTNWKINIFQDKPPVIKDKHF